MKRFKDLFKNRAADFRSSAELIATYFHSKKLSDATNTASSELSEALGSLGNNFRNHPRAAETSAFAEVVETETLLAGKLREVEACQQELRETEAASESAKKDLKARINDAQAGYKSASERASHYRKERESLTTRLSAARALEKKLDSYLALKEQGKPLPEEMVDLEQQVERARSDTKATERSLERLEQDLRAAEASLAAATARLSQAKENWNLQTKQIKQEIEKKLDKLNRANEERRACQKTHQGALEKLGDQCSNISNPPQELASGVQQIHLLRRKIEKLSSDSLSIRAHRNSLTPALRRSFYTLAAISTPLALAAFMVAATPRIGTEGAGAASATAQARSAPQSAGARMTPQERDRCFTAVQIQMRIAGQLAILGPEQAISQMKERIEQQQGTACWEYAVEKNFFR